MIYVLLQSVDCPENYVVVKINHDDVETYEEAKAFNAPVLWHMSFHKIIQINITVE